MLPLKSNIEKGLNLFSYGFLITICGYMIMGIIAAIAFVAFTHGAGETGEMFHSPFGWAPFDWYVIGLILANIVMTIALIFYIPGLWLINKGKWEFGPVHRYYIRKGIIFVLIGPIIGIFSIIEMRSIVPFSIIVSGIITSYGLLILVKFLADGFGRNILRIAAIIYVSLGMFVVLTQLHFFEPIFRQPVEDHVIALEFFIWGEVVPLMLNALYIIPITLFFMVYREARERILSGQAWPIMLPPQRMPPPHPQNPVNSVINEQQEIGLKPEKHHNED